MKLIGKQFMHAKMLSPAKSLVSRTKVSGNNKNQCCGTLAEDTMIDIEMEGPKLESFMAISTSEEEYISEELGNKGADSIDQQMQAVNEECMNIEELNMVSKPIENPRNLNVVQCYKIQFG